MRKLIVIAFALLVGCDDSPQPQVIPSSISFDSLRFSVIQAAKFKDTSAYNDERKIFIITDKQTGKEWVGVSGVGISEVGSHSETCGAKGQQCQVEDER